MSGYKSGSKAALALALMVAIFSAWMCVAADGIYCDRMPSMTIMATLSAFVIALCFRLFARSRASAQRVQLTIALCLAAATLFADARFVLKYRNICAQLQQQMHPGQ
jgi:cytochrome bd-type quinol oxidase subunit 2